MQSLNVPRAGQDYWKDEDPDFPLSDWQMEVANGDTRSGYWEWAQAKHQSDYYAEGGPRE